MSNISVIKILPAQQENMTTVLAISYTVEERTVLVDIPGSIRLSVSKKVTQGTRHLIIDIDEIRPFWIDEESEQETAELHTSSDFPRYLVLSCLQYQPYL